MLKAYFSIAINVLCTGQATNLPNWANELKVGLPDLLKYLRNQKMVYIAQQVVKGQAQDHYMVMVSGV